MLMIRAAFRCSVLWMLSSGCASSSATMRQGEGGVEAGAPVIEAVARTPAAPGETPAPSGYGYTPEDPIKVGGGPSGEHEFLRYLRGPEGQPLSFERLGSCCGFKDSSLPFGGGLLDMYEVTYEGLEKPVTLYLDMYRRQEPRAPTGFRLD
ncbi:hypothetical protein D187_009799 [Cystobacter fuscus DSM 2262]|uniref:Lipoprotein n=1 Tax=Cystobacter fuscus (strain ATCC 25194 / DSM 2262 / NBRC 100088 / M29) TaxID=1242864 RepID=S9NZ90_CYSF2|nr:hypothetical protein [Cystobacter fuscus]EPX57525.1 hypothetical protein D187_009799 [Cystobacter fuscus DSM 2262]